MGATTSPNPVADPSVQDPVADPSVQDPVADPSAHPDHADPTGVPHAISSMTPEWDAAKASVRASLHLVLGGAAATASQRRKLLVELLEEI